MNGNFETGGVADGDATNNPAQVPSGWSLIDGSSTGSFFGYFNPQNSTYLNTTGTPGVTGAMDGPNIFYFGTLGNGQGITQTLSSSFEANTNYTLTVAVGERLDAPMADLRISIYLADNLSTALVARTIPASEYAIPANKGTFTDYSVSYTWNNADSLRVGSALIVRLQEVGSVSYEVDVDNVRLVATPVPEPGSIGLAIVGGCILYWGNRARRSRS